ncbi:MAG TPA: hypothetical protein VJ608_02950, partial [Albitalea sp.]|nr:hypothetical protein [Albitalea sp.]
MAEVPLVVVLGASGSGKSSLVIGGALPLLAEPGHVPPYRIVGPLTPGNTPLESLVGAVAAVAPAAAVDVAAEVANIRNDPAHLVRTLHSAGESAILLVVDQFEEVFTLSDKAERRVLVAALAELSRVRPADRVILTMREEFSRELNELMPLSASARFSMSAWPMVYEDLKAAVEGPASLVNLHFQPGIVDDMVQGVLANGDTALPLLQFALSRLWLGRKRNRITWEVYKEIGGSPLKALETFADGVYDRVQEFEEKRAEFQRVMTELVRVNDLLEPYRQQVLRSELLAAGSAQTAEVLELLEENQFIRVTPAAGGDAVVEVKHEALLRNWRRYKEWIEAKREGIRRRIALTEAAQRWERDKSDKKKQKQGLLTAWQLHEVEALPDLSGLELEFVRTSQRAAVRDSNWKRARLVLGSGIVVALFLMLAWAWDERQQARETGLLRTMADAREAAINGRLGRALREAVKAAGNVQKPGAQALAPDARATLLSVLRGTNDLKRLFLKQQAVFQAVAFQPRSAHSLMAYAGSGGQTYLAELDGPLKQTLETCNSDVFVTALAFDPKGRWLAAGCADGNVALWSTADWGIKPHTTKVFNRTVWALAFSGDGRFLAAGGYDSKVRLLPIAEDGDPLRDKPLEAGGDDQPMDSVWSMAFSPKPNDNRLLVGDGRRRLLACAPLPDGSWECKDSAAYVSAGDD